MRILVSGSTGLVGSALVDRLPREGHEVVRLVRPETRRRDGEVSSTSGTAEVAWVAARRKAWRGSWMGRTRWCIWRAFRLPMGAGTRHGNERCAIVAWRAHTT